MSNCLLVLRNKKLNDFDGANGVITSFGQMGYYFDKVSFVAYDKSDDIVRALKDGRENYENFVIYCPLQMENAIKSFLNSAYSAEFNEFNVLNCGNDSAFMLFSDKKNVLKYTDIKQFLDKKYGVKYEKAVVKVVGAPSKLINKAILNAINANPAQAENVHNLVNFNVTDDYGDCTVEVVYSEEIPKIAFDKVFRTLVSSLEGYVYSVEDFSLAQRLFQLLKLRRMKISVAESFTGGGIGKKLVEVSGISEVYFEGLNTYSNEAKIGRLGVNDLTIHRFGAVSEQTACEMAEGLIKSGNCDICIATTGIAGPKSDNTKKPVGLVYIAIGTREGVTVYNYNLKGNRDEITNTAINLAMFLAYKTLK